MILDDTIAMPIQSCVEQLRQLHQDAPLRGDERGRQRTEVDITQHNTQTIHFRLTRKPDTPIETFMYLAVCEGQMVAHGDGATRIFAQVRPHFANAIAWFVVYAAVAGTMAALYQTWLIALVSFAIVASVDAGMRRGAERQLGQTMQSLFRPIA